MHDTKMIDDAISSLYEAVSGPAGADRDWSRERPYRHESMRLIRTGVEADGRPFATVMSAEEYVEDTREFFLANDFYEEEVDREVLLFGNIAHAWSQYEARHHPDDPEPFKRGINSIQLFFDGDTWKIVSVLWDNEREDNPL